MPKFPEALGYLWRLYLRLRRRIGHGFAGAQPLGFPDLDAFVRRTGVRLAPWEVEILEAIDDVYLQPDAWAPPAAPSVKTAAAAQDAIGVKAVLGAVGTRRRVIRNGKGNGKAKGRGSNGH